MERVKYAIDICQCLNDVYDDTNQNCNVQLQRVIQGQDVLGWTGVDAMLNEMLIVEQDNDSMDPARRRRGGPPGRLRRGRRVPRRRRRG